MSPKHKAIAATLAIISIFLSVAFIGFVLTRSKIKKKNKISDLQKILAEDAQNWKGKKETDPEVSPLLVKYWSHAGFDKTESQMQSTSYQSSWPWSAAYISSVIKRWINSPSFGYGAAHNRYVIPARDARKQENENVIYWAFQPNTQKVEPGDILVVRRGSNASLDQITTSTPLHGDIVAFTSPVMAVAQGGNLSNSIGRVTYPLIMGKTNSSNIVAHLKIKNIEA